MNMNFNSLGDTTPATPVGGPGQPEGGQQNLHGGDFAADMSGGTYSARGSKLGGVLLIACLIIVGAGSLWAMRMAGGAPAPDQKQLDTQRKIDSALAKLKDRVKAKNSAQAGQDPYGDTDSVVALFLTDPSDKQVNIDEIQKNPFELTGMEKKAAAAPVKKDQTDPREAKLKKLREELKKYTLQSVLNGSEKLAVVSGNILRVGDKIGSFTLVDVSGRGVKLSAENNTYSLAMDPENQ